MNDAKHPVVRHPAKPVEKPALPVIRGSTAPEVDVKIVAPDQVKTRKSKTEPQPPEA